jgi:oxygen-dependent protoporphyrinogen oxidase
MGSLVEALVAKLPADRLHMNSRAFGLERTDAKSWTVRLHSPTATHISERFNQIFLATPIDAARSLLGPVDPEAAALVPTDASSAVLASFCWPAEFGRLVDLPAGFGFLVPPESDPERSEDDVPKLLATTFTHQKFSARAPAGALVIRTFFGGREAERLSTQRDQAIASTALDALMRILPQLPTPDTSMTVVNRWPRSLPQYEIGHPDRITELDARIRALCGLHLLGNGYHGVGVPDLIRHARNAANGYALTCSAQNPNRSAPTV